MLSNLWDAADILNAIVELFLMTWGCCELVAAKFLGYDLDARDWLAFEGELDPLALF